MMKEQISLKKDSQYYMGLESHYGAKNYCPLNIVLSKASGVWVWDVDGNKYLDCLSAYSALNQGHLHPKIVEAAQDQLKKLTLTSRAFYNDQLGAFEKILCNFCGMESVIPMNTGAEAVETGIKMARRYAYLKMGIKENEGEIIVCDNNFHGRTTTIISFSSNQSSKINFGPFTPGFVSIPFNDPQSLKKAINKNTIGFLVEPIQGEAGVNIPDEGYLKEIRKICEEKGILLLLDEIQTGFGRTGKRFAFEHEVVKPDILLVGKALSGGIMPVSAALAKREIMDVFTPGSHGSTFGGNPLGCRVSIAAIDVIIDEKLAENAQKMGQLFLSRVKKLEKSSPIVKSVRGIGLLIAIEFKSDFLTSCRPIVIKLKENGILAKDTQGKIIRFAPPLIITEKQVLWATEIINEIILSYKY